MFLSKKRFKYVSLIGFVLFFSCQNAIEEQVYDTAETITKTSTLTTYLQRVAMVNTTDDDIIDTSSYFTIKMPYVVKVNGETIAINSSADYQLVSDNINASSDDDDALMIVFPVRIEYYNYEETNVDNQFDFEALLSYWETQTEILSKINCVNIVYPISINIYDSDDKTTSSITIISDRSFYKFLNNLKDTQFIAINYPISITDDEGNSSSIETNTQLETAITYANDNCSK